MRGFLAKLLGAAAILLNTPSAAAASAAAPGGVLADLPSFKDFKAVRYSSYDPTGGNADGRHDWPLKPGDTRTLADIPGAGAIVHLWFTIASPDTNHLKNLVLRMYWDGESAASVESPIGDFFGLGHGQYYQYWSTPIQIGVDKGLNCYWRMPFTNGARVTISNDGPLPAAAFYYYVDGEQHEVPQPDVARFHAQYRQAYPCPKGSNYVFLEATGRGHYVGCNLSVHNRAPGWWGEGDDMIYVDGEEKPSLHGTGAEDYFCGAWAYGEKSVKPFSGPYFGNPLNDGSHRQNARWNVYRYHIEDPVPFTKSIRVTIEHGHNNDRNDDYSSVAYWYQAEPHAPFPPLPKVEDRLPTPATVFVEAYPIFEGESLAPLFQNRDVIEQATLELRNHWSSGSHLLLKATQPAVYTANVPTAASEAGTYQVTWWYTAGPEYGQCEIWFNGAKVAEWDGYQAGAPARKKLDRRSAITVRPSGNVMEIRVIGKNASATGYHVGLDCFKVLPGFDPDLKPSSTNPVDASPRFEDVLKIDAHAHFFDDVPELAAMLQRTRTRVINICVGGNQPELLRPSEQRAEQLRRQYAPSFAFASTFDRTRWNEPGYAAQVTHWLDATFEAGAVLTKIWKDVGMELRTPTGAFLLPDDPVFDPIYAHLAQRRRPLMAHFADPIDAWRPLDPKSPHHAYYASHPEWHLHGKPGFPSHADILSARDRMLAKHPDLVVIAAHLGSETHDLDSLGRRFDRFPNLYADVSARTPELQRRPAAQVREFFLRYPDRLLYGTDAEQYTPGREPTAEEKAAFVTRMESWYRRDFDYYAGQGTRTIGEREVECLGLPRAVLEKFYHRNAQRLMPGLKGD